MKLTLFLVIVLLLSQSAFADPYHRFWRGSKLENLSTADFIEGLNNAFISQTIEVGAGKGLIAYQPVLPNSTSLPDEIALVSYQDQASYNAIRSTPEGQAYSELHWKYFDHKQSLSVVPETYSGDVSIEHAYDLHPHFDAWKSALTHVQIEFRNSGEDEGTYLKRAQMEFEEDLKSDESSAVVGRVALVTSTYWVEYVAKKRLVKHLGMNPIVTNYREFTAGKMLTLPVEHKPVKSAKLKPGSGVNVQF